MALLAGPTGAIPYFHVAHIPLTTTGKPARHGAELLAIKIPSQSCKGIILVMSDYHGM